MNALKITSWNVKPHTTDKLKLLAETAASLNAAIVILQETRRTTAAGQIPSRVRAP